MQTHGINRFSLLRQWSCSCPATCQHALCESKTTNELTVLLFCDIHIDKVTTLNLLQCLHVICGYRAIRLTMLRYHWHCCICSYSHNIISSRSSHYSLNALVYVVGQGPTIASVDSWVSRVYPYLFHCAAGFLQCLIDQSDCCIQAEGCSSRHRYLVRLEPA